MLHFMDVNGDNYRKCCALRVAPEQETYVANAIGILGKAYAYREEGARVQIICEDQTMVGMLMTRFWPADNCYILDQFFIDQQFQRRGYGTAALRLLLDQLRKEGRFPSVFTSYYAGNDAAKDLYLQSGFLHTGEDEEEGVIGMSRSLMENP